MTGVKTCRGCGQTKPADAFHRKADGGGGLDSRCKDCRSQAARDRAAATRCRISDCPRPANAPHGLCRSHYERQRRYGTPTAGPAIRGYNRA